VADGLQQHKTRSWWAIQTHLDEQWTAIGYFWPVDGGWRLSELRILPRGSVGIIGQTFDAFAAWKPDAAAQVVPALPPPGEIHAQLLRKVPLRHWQQTVAEWAALRAHFFPTASERSTTSFRDRFDAEPAPTSAQLTTLLVATVYAEHALRMANPNPVVKARLGLDSTAQVRDRLTAARRLGYLQRAGRGRAGGALTPKGAALAERYDRELRSIKRQLRTRGQ
jgi:hypothetical protein